MTEQLLGKPIVPKGRPDPLERIADALEELVVLERKRRMYEELEEEIRKEKRRKRNER